MLLQLHLHTASSTGRVFLGRDAQGSPSLPCHYKLQQGFLQTHLEAALAESKKTGGGTEETPTSIIAGITITTENLILHLEEIPAQAAASLISCLT